MKEQTTNFKVFLAFLFQFKTSLECPRGRVAVYRDR